jgi:hypothetical protein
MIWWFATNTTTTTTPPTTTTKEFSTHPQGQPAHPSRTTDVQWQLPPYLGAILVGKLLGT